MKEENKEIEEQNGAVKLLEKTEEKEKQEEKETKTTQNPENTTQNKRKRGKKARKRKKAMNNKENAEKLSDVQEAIGKKEEEPKEQKQLETKKEIQPKKKLEVKKESQPKKELEAKKESHLKKASEEQKEKPKKETKQKEEQKEKDEDIEKQDKPEKEASKEETKQASPKNRLKTTIILIVTGIIIVIIAIMSTIFAVININNPKIIKKISIGGIDVSNMTKEEAKQVLEEKYATKLQNKIYLKHNEFESTITYQALEVKYKIEEAVEQAYSIGRCGNVFKNNAEIIKTWTKGREIEVNIEQH